MTWGTANRSTASAALHVRTSTINTKKVPLLSFTSGVSALTFQLKDCRIYMQVHSLTISRLSFAALAVPSFFSSFRSK